MMVVAMTTRATPRQAESARAELPSELPVLALRDGALLPDESTQIAVGRPSSLAALLAAARGGGHVVVVAQRAPDIDEPGRDDLFEVGCAARLGEIVNEADGVSACLDGLARVRIEAIVGESPMIARTSLLPDPVDADPPLAASVVARLRDLALDVLSRTRMSKAAAATRVAEVAGPGRVANMIAGALAMSVRAKQRFLEIDDVAERVRILDDPARLELGPGGGVPDGWLSRLFRRR